MAKLDFSMVDQYEKDLQKKKPENKLDFSAIDQYEQKFKQPALGQQLLNLPGAVGRGLIAGGAGLISGLANADKFQKQLMANVIPDTFLTKPIKDVYQRSADVDINVRDFMNQKAAEQDVAMERSGNIEKGAFNLVKPIPQIVGAMATGPVAPLTFGVIAVGQYAQEAEKEGAGVLQQLAYGSIMGVVEGLTEKIPLGNFGKTFTQPFKQSLVSYLKNISAEGIQEATSQIVSGLSKQVIYKPDQFITNGQLDWNKVKQAGVESVQAGLTGIGTATLLGGTGLALSGKRGIQQRPQAQLQPVQNLPADVNNIALESVTGPSEVTPERRINDRLRETLQNMNQEEMKSALFTQDKTGMLNDRVYQEVLNNPILRKPVQLEADVDGLKWVNDNYGHEAGDQLLKNMATGLKSLGHEDVFHKQGDEFFAQFDTPEQTHDAMKKVDEVLKSSIIKVTTPDGQTMEIRGGGFSYGIGKDVKEADTNLLAAKQLRTEQGLRGTRGEKPPSLLEGTNGIGANTKGIENTGNVGNLMKIVSQQTKPNQTEPVSVSPPVDKEWFENSKVVDEKGEPLVVYHGTGGDKTGFNTFAAHQWFTDSLEYAKTYATRPEYNGKNPTIYKSYLSIKKPFDVTRLGNLETEMTRKEFADKLGLSYGEVATGKKQADFVEEGLSQKLSKETPKPAFEILNSELFKRGYLVDSGYDGIVAIEQGNKSYSPFSSDQIKVVNNTPPTPNQPVKTNPRAFGEVVEGGSKEPWQMTKEEFQNKSPKGFKFNPSLIKEATTKIDGTIEIGPKFFEIKNEVSKKHIVSHEISHNSGLEEVAAKDNTFWDLVQNKKMFGPIEENGKIQNGINGQYRPNENLTEAYTTLLEDSKWLKEKYPIAYDYVSKLALQEGKPVPPEVLKDYPELVKESKVLLGHSKKYGTFNPYIQKNPYWSEIKKLEQSGKPNTPELLNKSRAWEINQVVSGDKPAYLGLEKTEAEIDNLKKISKDNGLFFGMTNDNLPVIAKTNKDLIAVMENYNAEPKRHRELGLALGYEDINNVKKGILQNKELPQEIKKESQVKTPKGLSNADMGGYAIDQNVSERSPIELPELVELAKEINEGKAPHVKEKLGDALGRFQANEKGSNILLRADIFKDSKLATRVMAHEIGHMNDYFPEKTLSRGNILGRIAALKKYMKSSLDEEPPVVKNNVIKELKDLSMKWKPFDPKKDPKYTLYRNSSKELYADAVSVLLNDPKMLEKEAPTFHNAFFKHLDKKPEFKAAYEDIQNRLTNPDAVGQHRLEGARQMLKETNPLREEARKRAQKEPLTISDTISKYLIDRDYPILELLNKGIKQGGKSKELGQKAKWNIEETKYIAAEVGAYMDDVSKSVLSPMNDADLNVEDIGVYMLAKRASTERSTIANPRGLDEAAAKQMLKDLSAKLGQEKFGKLESIIKDYRTIHEQLIDRAEESGMYSPELIKTMRENKDYAKFSVAHYLEDKIGGGMSAKIYHQVGTLSDIENPFIATVLQDISMMRAAKLNTAKRAVIDSLKEGNYATDAELGFNGQGMSPKDPKDPNQTVFTVLVDGKPKSYYIDKEIAATFERNPVEATKLAELLSNLTSPIKQILVSRNPIWMARNLIKDFTSTTKNVSQVQLRDVPKLLGYYNKAVREVYQYVFGDYTSADIMTMKKNYMLNPDRIYSGKDVSFDNEIERLSTEWQVNPNQAEQYKGAKGKLKQAWGFLNDVGRVSEMTGKVTGFKYLKNETNLSQQEIGHIVRTRIGTPDARRQGALHQITNNVFMFSNIGKEGIRSMAESFNDNPSRYIWKTMMINVIPKMILVGAAVAGSKELKDLIDKIPEYDKQNYNIIPLAIAENGKAMYLRIPQDYEGQTWSAITWALSHGKFTGDKGALDIVSQNNPYSLNPVLQVAGNLYTYYIKGKNPIDEFRGNPIIPQKQFIAGIGPSTIALGKNSWQSLGGSVIYNPGDYSDRNATEIEKALKMPGLNIFGSFLRYSDKGEQEKIYAQQDEEAKQKAQQSLKVENIIVDSVKKIKSIPDMNNIKTLYAQLKLNKTIGKDETLNEFKNRYHRYAAKAISDSNLSMVLKAPSLERRLEILDGLKQSLSFQKYQQLTFELQKMGVVISKPKKSPSSSSWGSTYKW
jgi:diguanylate cyclase (GGDEF)-like protein